MTWRMPTHGPLLCSLRSNLVCPVSHWIPCTSPISTKHIFHNDDDGGGGGDVNMNKKDENAEMKLEGGDLH